MLAVSVPWSVTERSHSVGFGYRCLYAVSVGFGYRCLITPFLSLAVDVHLGFAIVVCLRRFACFAWDEWSCPTGNVLRGLFGLLLRFQSLATLLP
jgi:hypothetical protein